jgi:predicted peptidase
MLKIILAGGLNASGQSLTIDPAVHKQTFVYAQKDTAQLSLDLYDVPTSNNNPRPCVIFAFGGAFIGGHRDDTLYNRYFSSLAKDKYIVVSISYRLGLKGVKNLSLFNIAPLRKAVAMAVDDLYDATNWVLANAQKYNIDTTTIILSGSSSGAITALTADYERRAKKTAAAKLPENFEYAGVVAFAGAILSMDWGLKYQIPPAPMLLFQGTADKIVPVDHISFLNKGLYGSASIAKTAKDANTPYYLYQAIGLGHEMAVLPMIGQDRQITEYLDELILEHKPYQIEMRFKDPDQKPLMTLTPKQLFEKLQNKN